MTHVRLLKRRVHRSAAVATATGLFAFAALGSAAVAFAGQDSGTVAVTGASVVMSVPSSPASIPLAAADAIRTTNLEAAQVVAELRAAEKAAEAAAAAKKAAAKAAAVAAAKKTAAKQAAARAATKAANAQAKASAVKAAAPSTRTVTISRYTNAPGSQAAIDKCQLVLWSSSPMWLAAHNWCGYQWLAYVKTGTTVVVSSGAARGTYVVYDHLRLGRQSGAMPRTGADLVLQTCVGTGTGLTLLRRV